MSLAALLLGAALAGCGGAPESSSAGSGSLLSDVSLSATADVTPPSAPGNLSWSSADMTVVLAWQPSTDDVGVVGYDLYYGSYYLGAFTDTSLALIGFKAGTPYTFTVKARDAAGNVSLASNQATVLLGMIQDTVPPSAPTNVAATNVTSNAISLRWTSSTDNVGVVVYQVYVGNTLSGTVTAPTATVGGLQPNTSYNVTVTASDAAGNVSAVSGVLAVTTAAGVDTTPPSVPTGLVASSVTSSSVTLTWNPSTDNVGVTGYDISVSTLDSIRTATTTTFTWSSLQPATQYTFAVRAKDAAGNVSGPSASLTVMTGTSGRTLTITAGSGGTTDPAPGTYSYQAGATVSVTATASSGYTFAGWSGAATGTTNPVTVTMDADQTLAATFTATPQSVSINVGGPATGTFLADAYFSGGTTYSSTSTVDTSGLTGTAPPAAVFQTERYGPFTYTIPNLTAGAPYVVTLYFAETYLSAAGQRLFDVTINGTKVLTGFDIFAAAGGQNKAVAQSFNATASSGQVAIQFIAGTENPKVCGITVAPGSLSTYSLSVSKSGTGTGSVSGGGITCGTACSANVVSGTSVTLTATPDAGSTFSTWGGACSGTSPTCTVKMDGSKTVTASFSLGGGGGGGGGTGTPSAGCGKTSTLTFGTVPGESGSSLGTGAGGYVTIQSSGQSRGFAVRLPDNYDKNKPYWLIFGFHWNGGSSKDVDTGGSNGYGMAHFGLQSLSKNGAIFVAPQGLNSGWANSGGQDLKFVDDMVQLLQNNYCVDTSRIYTNGFSYGGGMSYEIACSRAKVFRAAAIYEGAQLSGCDGGTDPIALWQMVGLEDNVCGMNLATPIRDRFVSNNHCTLQSPPQPAKAPPYLNPGGHICTDYAGCSAGHPLRWCVHQSGHGNAIVDGTGDLYNSCATPPKTCSASCPCTWVPADVWKFFTAL
jgi:uncharacterized repeat protein (TIGR02543 family)